MTLDNLLANVFSEAHSVTDLGSAERCSRPKGMSECARVSVSLCLNAGSIFAIKDTHSTQLDPSPSPSSSFAFWILSCKCFDSLNENRVL